MKIVFAKTVLLSVLAAGIFAAVLFFPLLNKACCSGEYKTFLSPDGHWAVKVYRINNIPLMIPGSSGDALGYVRLVDRQGTIFAEQDVEMVQLVEQVEWSKTQVNIKFVADWILPEASPLPPR